MSILTTCIGAYPKPDYLALPDWFNSPEGVDTVNPTELWQKAFDALGDDAEQILHRAVEDVVGQQISAGIDVPTDGEVLFTINAAILKALIFQNSPIKP